MPVDIFWTFGMKMKGIVILLVLAIVLIASCTPGPSGPTPGPSPAPEAVPSPPPEPTSTSPPAPTPKAAYEQPSTPTGEPEQPPAQEPTPPESRDTTMQFAWSIDTGIRLEDATVPYVHRLEDGRFRIYYGGPGGITSAISEDALTFKKDSGVRIPSGNLGSPEAITSDPTLVVLEDGRVRMYYKGASGPGGPGQSVHSIFSAISTDGLSFEKEGIRIDSQQTSDRGWASVPEAIVLPDGKVRIYYVSDGLDVKHGIVSAISEDGLNFTREETRLTGFVDPAIVKLPDGSYLMLAVAFPFGPGGRLTNDEPGIYSFISSDGINFRDRKLVLAGENNIDPTIVDVGGGAYRVYYWNATESPPKIKSITGTPVPISAPSTAPISASAPSIIPVQAPRSIPGVKQWLFAVDDGAPQLALSAEADGKLLMGRLDVTRPSATLSWQTVAGPTDTGGVSIADHWHIFAHGYHWIVFSVAGNSASYLLKLDKDFQRLALVPVGHTDGPTNDMFMVAEPDGMAVAHFAPGYGHTVHQFDVQAVKTGEVRIGGGRFIHANGSSAIPVDGGYLLFASETLNPSATSAVRLIQFDAFWRPVSVSAVFDENGTNAAMPTAIRTATGYTIVHLRTRTGVSPRGKEPLPTSPQPSPLSDDSGALVRLVLAPDGTVISRETPVSDGTNRPHTTMVGDLLITTWDETGAVYLRVDRIH